ncbi:hypothetical protein XI04_03035 [Bradyrhizobium sp. CCBAU 11430]|nr:hypothetical protein [Bradyrhizobium sp. CCBAU 11430]
MFEIALFEEVNGGQSVAGTLPLGDLTVILALEGLFGASGLWRGASGPATRPPGSRPSAYEEG